MSDNIINFPEFNDDDVILEQFKQQGIMNKKLVESIEYLTSCHLSLLENMDILLLEFHQLKNKTNYRGS